ncbi:tyrosine-type recombinase/integrase [Sediminicola luteus]|uniref:tyrosine-type recombinase/integrase n=1 Tax=Sediminicola luteus TaxID=319238 RepID=UPI001553A339|nr:site-specific integrase [Sediminicola luteus]
MDCESINRDLFSKSKKAQELIHKLGQRISDLDIDFLVKEIQESWEDEIDDALKLKMRNRITLKEWGGVMINRKLKTNSPGTGAWYKSSIRAFVKFNQGKDIPLIDIDVTFLKEFEIALSSQGTANGGISSYMRAVRAIYNSAIYEDKLSVPKNPFHYYRLPSTPPTKKRALDIKCIQAIRNLRYEEGSILWHTRNYTMIMFNCRGMNFIDLTKLRMKNIFEDRLYYGRSKTGDPLSVKITRELFDILQYYIHGKRKDDFLFPVKYDGSTEMYETYKTYRTRMNKRLKVLAKDAGINENLTTYTIRHSWATIAKHIGISTEIISEGLGHSSLKTTEIYLKSFGNKTLDDANELVLGATV